jgi:hypothetical protein
VQELAKERREVGGTMKMRMLLVGWVCLNIGAFMVIIGNPRDLTTPEFTASGALVATAFTVVTGLIGYAAGRESVKG